MNYLNKGLANFPIFRGLTISTSFYNPTVPGKEEYYRHKVKPIELCPNIRYLAIPTRRI
jgi:hypothetical protein